MNGRWLGWGDGLWKERKDEELGEEERRGMVEGERREGGLRIVVNPFFPTVPTCAVRETASLGIMGPPRVPPLSPSETIVF